MDRQPFEYVWKDILDSDLSFEAHITKVAKVPFFHLRNVAKLRLVLTKLDAKKLTHVFISSVLDYCNALFTGLPKELTVILQLVQNSATRLSTKTRKRDHSTPVLSTLHWTFKHHIKQQESLGPLMLFFLL